MASGYADFIMRIRKEQNLDPVTEKSQL